MPKLPPLQADLPLDPDDLFSTSGEEMGPCSLQTSASDLCSLQRSASDGAPPNVLPGDRELCGPRPLRDESQEIGCWNAEHEDISSTPLVVNTNKTLSPASDSKMDDQGGYDFGSPSREFPDPDSQFDELMEEFISPDDFCDTFSRFEDEDAVTRDNLSTGGLGHEAEGKEVITLSSDDESDRLDEVEEVDHVRIISDVAADAGISDLFDPRVLGTCVERVKPCSSASTTPQF